MTWLALAVPVYGVAVYWFGHWMGRRHAALSHTDRED